MPACANIDPFWHKARVVARIWLKKQQGKPLSARDKRVGRALIADKGVTNRLIEQARTYWTARHTLDENLNFKPRARRVVDPQH